MTTDGDVGSVAEDLASVARQLESETTPVQTWQRIVDLAVDKLDGCEMAAISLVYNFKRIDTPVYTDPLTLRVDEVQYETGQGPCVDSIRDHEVVETADLLVDDRWPQFGRRASEATGIRSMVGFRLFVRENTLGALNLYSTQVAAFDDEARQMGSLFAAHAALAMASAAEHEHGEQLENALESSRVIGVAVGILMEQSSVNRAAAFRILSLASQRSNVKLRELAERIVAGVEGRAEQAASVAPLRASGGE
jgi:transcriptional regulator with GAF, ATPase, and Fis domain